MKEFFNILHTVPLFENISDQDLEQMLNCLSAQVKSFKKNRTIVDTEDDIAAIGVVLSGTIQESKNDAFGNRTILSELSMGNLFLETLACAGVKKSPHSVNAITDCQVLFIDYQRSMAFCSNACSFHTRFIKNMLSLFANKNLLLNKKLEMISQRNTRDKLLTYLSSEKEKGNSNKFTIPFSRNELADFLCVERSAMSRELSRMKIAGLLSFMGNEFEIL